ncbi:hypothetical protein KEM55_007098 [Ascosphaera atra]|nr:hypothetical protein KEM55_007098 [Ascosphaera atra]
MPREANSEDRGSSYRRHRDDRQERHMSRNSKSPQRSPHRHHKSSRTRNRSHSPHASRRDRSPSHRSSRHAHRDRDDRHRHSRRHASTSRSRSPRPSRHHRSRRSVSPASPATSRKLRKPLPSQVDAFNKDTPAEGSGADTPAPEKEKPNYGTSGRLAAETNTVTARDGSTVVLKYHEPPEARKPPSKDDWRLYVFKGQDLLETLQLGTQSCWLVGREQLVVDLPTEHPSCSKQHAAIQFRYIEKRNEYGDKLGRVRPYLIDLESANGSTVNGSPAPPGRYIELRDKDIVQFGNSAREYVLMLAHT